MIVSQEDQEVIDLGHLSIQIPQKSYPHHSDRSLYMLNIYIRLRSSFALMTENFSVARDERIKLII